MTFWNFTKITPPSPSDPLVNEQTQLNDNWDYADERLSFYNTSPVADTHPDAEVGQEWIYNGRLGVWNGSALVFPQDIDAAWTSWSVFALTAPVNYRSGFVPRWRRNTLLKQVELGGCAIYNAAAAWPLSFTTISADTEVGGIPVAYQPNNGITYMPVATSIPSADNRGAGSIIAIDDGAGAGPSVRIRGRWMGASGGGNFVALDGVRWYYA